MKYKRFNLAQYNETKGERQRESLKSGFEAMDFGRYIEYVTTELPASERLNQDDAIQAWQRDQSLLEKEKFEVRDAKTGEWEQRDHLWVPLRTRKKNKVHEAFEEKKSEKIFRSQDPDNAALAPWLQWLLS